MNKNTFGKRWGRACVGAGLAHRAKNERGVLVYVGKHFLDIRRNAARNMIRAGLPQSIAMRVTDNGDSLAALEAGQRLRGILEKTGVSLESGARRR